MIAAFNGVRVRIPKGYRQTDDSTFINGHGVEYALVSYGEGDAKTICLETIYSKHTRTIELEVIEDTMNAIKFINNYLKAKAIVTIVNVHGSIAYEGTVADLPRNILENKRVININGLGDLGDIIITVEDE